MGSYVLYTLMQALGALVFAYLSGVLAMRLRTWYMLMVASGMYLILGASLVEIWGDRAGWTEGGLGLHVALVSIGVVAMGSGSILREAGSMEDPRMASRVAWVLLGAGAVLGGALAATAGSSSSVVDPEGAFGANLGGGFSHLGAAGIAMAAPLFLGAVLVAVSGARASLVRGDGRALWMWAAGILYFLWPLDLKLGELPLSPSILLMAIATTYFGYQEREEKTEEAGTARTGTEGSSAGATAMGERPGPVQMAMERWSHEEGSGDGPSPGVDRGEEPSSEVEVEPEGPSEGP